MKLAFAILLVSSAAAAEPLPLWTVEQHYAPSGTQRTMFVLYDDGRVIWSTQKHAGEKGTGYSTALLDSVARDRLLAALPSHDAFAALPEFTEAAPNTTDGVATVICAFTGDKRCVIVHGTLDAKNPERAKSPALGKLWDQLLSYAAPEPKAWSPETVEVRLYAGKPHGAPSPWPAKWNAPVVPHGEDYWTTTIPGDDLRELQKTIDQHRQFVLGVRRRDATYVVKLPAEERWRR